MGAAEDVRGESLNAAAAAHRGRLLLLHPGSGDVEIRQDGGVGWGLGAEVWGADMHKVSIEQHFVALTQQRC